MQIEIVIRAAAIEPAMHFKLWRGFKECLGDLMGCDGEGLSLIGRQFVDVCYPIPRRCAKNAGSW